MLKADLWSAESVIFPEKYRVGYCERSGSIMLHPCRPQTGETVGGN